MKKKVILGLVVLLLLAGVVLLWMFTAATSREAVRLRLSEATGASVELGGVERLWWPLGMRAYGADFQATAYSLQARQLEVRVALLPLLWGQAKPDSISLSEARLELRQGSAGGPALPLDTNWTLDQVELWAPVGGESKLIFYLDHATLEARERRARLEIVGGASAAETGTVQIEGGARDWQPGAFPTARLQVQVNAFPAQPLLGYLVGDQRVLATAELEGALSLKSEPGVIAATGSLGATASPEEELLALIFQGKMTPELLTVESLSGSLAGNRIEGSGRSRRLAERDWETEIEFRLPDARLDDDTLDRVHEALGRDVLGIGDDLRGPFSAEGKFVSGGDQETISGRVDLGGMRYAPRGQPPLEDIRGQLTLQGPRVQFSRVTARVFDIPVRLGGEVHGAQLALTLQTDDVPLASLPLPVEVSAHIANLMGTVRAQVEIGGQVYRPAISGVAAMKQAGFDAGEIGVRNVEGAVKFDPQKVRFDSLEGHLGGCPFELAGGFELPNWPETLVARWVSPACELTELVRLAEQGGLGPVPGLQAETLSGAAALRLDYEEQRWQAELEIEDARWAPAWLSLPLEGIGARIEGDPARIEIDHLRAHLGASPVSAQGHMELEGASPGAWELAVKTELEPQDAGRLIPSRAQKWVRVPGVLSTGLQLSRATGNGVKMTAQVQALEPVSAEGNGNSASDKATSILPQISLEGSWQEGKLLIDALTASVGSTEVRVQGEVGLAPQKKVNLTLHLPSGSSLEELASIVRLPEVLQSLEGRVGADLSIEGAPENLSWLGGITLEEVRVPHLLTEPVYLQGGVELRREGVLLQDVVLTQPLGTLTVSGLFRWQGPSDLRAIGPWANLDRLLGQLPEGELLHPHQGFLGTHPVRVSIALEEVQFLGVVLKGVEGELEHSERGLSLHVPRFGFGPGRGRLEIQPNPGSNRVRARLWLEEIPLEMLLVDLMKQDPTVRGPLAVQADLLGPLARQEEFLRKAEGEITFDIGGGRIQRGTLPERLFALAVMLREHLYGFSLLRLGWSLAKPRGLRRFREWNGTIQLEEGKARLRESRLVAKEWEVDMTGELDLGKGDLQVHGEGNFHPGFQFDLSLKSFVNVIARLFRLARGKGGHNFEFDVEGSLGGTKRVKNFRFKD